MKTRIWIFFFLMLALLSPQYSFSQGGGRGLLLNAEAFGFGPAAATAQLFHELRSQKRQLGYLGEGHTVTIQENLPYDDIIQLPPGASESEIREQLRFLSSRYGYFFTTCDHRYARIAQEEGYRVGLFDILTWFWPTIPENTKNLDLYVAQNYVNVKDRIRDERERFPEHTEVIPPIVCPLKRWSVADLENSVLLNLGGLSNPYISDEIMGKFVRLIAMTLKQALEGRVRRVVITTNPRFKAEVPEALTFGPKEIQNQLERVEFALMTSGLGNISEASSATLPVIWLPPTNDSQGQQIELLKRDGMVDWALDWGDLTESQPINYFEKQETVMKMIQAQMIQLLESPSYQKRFQRVLAEKIDQVLRFNQALKECDASHSGEQIKLISPDLKLGKFVERFGQDGLKGLRSLVLEWCKNE